MAKRQRHARASVPDAPPARRPAAVPVWMPLLLSAAAIAIYAASLPAPYLPDDERAIRTNPQIRSLAPATALAPPRDTPVAGRPLVNLTFAINYALHGTAVTGYRAVNIGLHIAGALLLFGLVRRTIVNAGLAPDGIGAAGLAWLSAVVWLVHPLQTEAVVYLSQRSELMMGVAYLATLYCTARGWTTAAVLACAAGMLCKESMVTAPVAVLLYERVFRFTSFREAFKARRGFYLGLAGTWGILGAVLLSRPRSSVGFDAGISAWTYLLNQCGVIVHYLTQVFWPSSLVWDYGLPRTLSAGDVWAQATFLLAALALAVVLLYRSPVVGLLLFWVFLTLAPTSSVVPITTEVGAERRMYLPLAGLAVLVVLAGHRALRRLPPQVTYVAVMVGCAGLAVTAYQRTQDYHSIRRLAETSVERWPNARARFQLAVVLYEDEATRADAVRLMREAAPEFAGARYALGIHYVSENRLNEAAGELEAFLRLMPDHANAVAAHDVLGRILLSQGRADEAMRHFDTVLRVPGYPQRPQVVQLRQQAAALRGRS